MTARLGRIGRGAMLVVASALIGCEEPSADAPPNPPASTATTSTPPPSTPPPSTPPQSTARRGYEIPIPQLEYWDGTQVLKYSYEMRFDPPDEAGGRPRLHRNGWARAYYLGGQLEREGAYRYVANLGRSERVGLWTYYTPEGAVDRTEDRGGPVVWTGPDQTIAPPGTEPSKP